MTVHILPPAEDDLDAAVAYYASIDPQLAHRLLCEFEAILERIETHPLLYRKRPGGYHRVNLHVFPYYVSYIIRMEGILIVALASSDLPEDWLERLPQTH